MKLALSLACGIGTVYVWSLTRAAILDGYNFCGTPHVTRFCRMFPISLVGIPLATGAVIATWKRVSKIDYVTKVTCLSFLATVALYWWFDR